MTHNLKFINLRETRLKQNLEYIQTQLKKAHNSSIAVVAPQHLHDLKDEIIFIKDQLSKIRDTKKSMLKVVR